MSQMNANNNQPLELEQLLPSYQDNFNVREETLALGEEVSEQNTWQLDGNLTEQTDWFTLAHQLRQHNRELLAKVAQLEQALATSQQQGQLPRSPTEDCLSVSPAEEVKSTQEQIDRLLREMETAQENTQSQQLQIESFSQQLEASQGQLAHLEREYALLEKNYNQQTQQLLESERQVQELRSRLQRQQRYTLQYKAALDEYLKSTAVVAAVSQTEESPLTPAAPVPKVQPIQPWSTPQELEEPAEKLNLIPTEAIADLDYQTLVAQPTVSPSEMVELAAATQEQQQLAIRGEEASELDVAPLAGDSEPERDNLMLEPQQAAALPGSANLLRDRYLISAQAHSPSHLIAVVPPNKKRKSNKPVDLPKFSC